MAHAPAGDAAPTAFDDNKLIAERRGKLTALRTQQQVPFPNDFRRDALAAEIVAGYGELDGAALAATPGRAVGGQAVRV